MLSQNSNGIISVLKNMLSGSAVPKSASSGSAVSPAVNSQLIASFGSVDLNDNLQAQNLVQVPNYNNMAMSSMKLHISVTDTTSTSVPTGVNSIENVIKTLKLQTANGVNIFDFDGSLLDISCTARYLNPNGVVNNSPTPADSAASTGYTETWDIIIPFSVAAKYFPAKLFVVVNTLSSRATTLNGMTSTVNAIDVYANYHNVSVIDQAIVNQTLPVASTGNINLSTNYLQNRTYYMQAYQYGDVQSSSATDSPIGATGNGITFTPNGALYNQNTPLQAFIDKENTQYPNTVSTGVGHEIGMINLFSDVFEATAATQLSIDFTSAPSTGGASGQSNQIRAIWVTNLA